MTSLLSLDLLIVSFFAAHRPTFLSYLMIGMSELGNMPMILGLSLIIALVLIYRRHWYLVSVFILEMALVGIVRGFVPALISRARPPVILQAYHEVGFSFPSGHATWSLALYGFIAFAVWHFAWSKRTRVVSVVGLTILVFLVGFSRVVLSVHYPSDIIGGWMFAGLCLASSAIVVREIRMRVSLPIAVSPRHL